MVRELQSLGMALANFSATCMRALQMCSAAANDDCAGRDSGVTRVSKSGYGLLSFPGTFYAGGRSEVNLSTNAWDGKYLANLFHSR